MSKLNKKLLSLLMAGGLAGVGYSQVPTSLIEISLNANDHSGVTDQRSHDIMKQTKLDVNGNPHADLVPLNYVKNLSDPNDAGTDLNKWDNLGASFNYAEKMNAKFVGSSKVDGDYLLNFESSNAAINPALNAHQYNHRGELRGAAAFNGSNAALYNVKNGLFDGDRSISFWIKPMVELGNLPVDTEIPIMSFGDSAKGVEMCRVFLRVNTATSYQVKNQCTNGSDAGTAYANSGKFGEWGHFVVTKQASSVWIYSEGGDESWGGDTNFAAFDASYNLDTFTIGTEWDKAGRLNPITTYTNGQPDPLYMLSDVRIYDSKITHAEALDIMAENEVMSFDAAGNPVSVKPLIYVPNISGGPVVYARNSLDELVPMTDPDNDTGFEMSYHYQAYEWTADTLTGAGEAHKYRGTSIDIDRDSAVSMTDGFSALAIVKHDYTPTTNQYVFDMRQNGTGPYLLRNTNSWYSAHCPGTGVTNRWTAHGSWTYIGVVCDGTRTRLYVNNDYGDVSFYQTSDIATPVYVDARDITIGTHRTNKSAYDFNGWIGKVAFYDTTLSLSQMVPVLRRLNDFAPPVANDGLRPDKLVFHLPMDEHSYDMVPEAQRYWRALYTKPHHHVHKVGGPNLVETAKGMTEHGTDGRLHYRANSTPSNNQGTFSVVYQPKPRSAYTSYVNDNAYLFDGRQGNSGGSFILRNSADQITGKCNTSPNLNSNTLEVDEGYTYRITLVCNASNTKLYVYNMNTGTYLRQDVTGDPQTPPYYITSGSGSHAVVWRDFVVSDYYHSNTPRYHSRGMLADFRVYNIELDETEVHALGEYHRYDYIAINTTGGPSTAATINLPTETTAEIKEAPAGLPANFLSCGGATKLEVGTSTLSYLQVLNEMITPEDKLGNYDSNGTFSEITDTASQAYTDAVNALTSPLVLLMEPSQANTEYRYYVTNLGLSLKQEGATDYIFEEIPLDAYITVDVPPGATEPTCWKQIYMFASLDRVFHLLNPSGATLDIVDEDQLDSNGEPTKLGQMSNLGTPGSVIDSFFPKRAIAIKLGADFNTTEKGNFPMRGADHYYAFLGNTPSGSIYTNFKKGRDLGKRWKEQKAAATSTPQPAKKEDTPSSTPANSNGKKAQASNDTKKKRLDFGAMAVSLTDYVLVGGTVPSPGILFGASLPAMNSAAVRIALSPLHAIPFEPSIYGDAASNIMSKEEITAITGFEIPSFTGNLGVKGTMPLPALPIASGSIQAIINDGGLINNWTDFDPDSFGFDAAPTLGINASLDIGLKLTGPASLITDTALFFGSFTSNPPAAPDLRFQLGTASFYWGQYQEFDAAGQNFWPDIKFIAIAGIGDAVDMVLNNVANIENTLFSTNNVRPILEDLAPTAEATRYGQINKHIIKFGSHGEQGLDIPGLNLITCIAQTELSLEDTDKTNNSAQLSDWELSGFQSAECSVLNDAAVAYLAGDITVSSSGAEIDLDALLSLSASSGGWQQTLPTILGFTVYHMFDVGLEMTGNFSFDAVGGSVTTGVTIAMESPTGFNFGFKISYLGIDRQIVVSLLKGFSASGTLSNKVASVSFSGVSTGKGVSAKLPNYPCIKYWYWTNDFIPLYLPAFGMCTGPTITLIPAFNAPDVTITKTL